jgi:hypothetical protein
VALAVLAATVTNAARAQAIPARTPEIRATVPDRPGPSWTVPLSSKPGLQPLASLVLPGSGQLASGKSRGIVYLAVEAWLISRALAAGQRGRAERAQYQTLAYDVARRVFTPIRVDGPFEYYETMEKFVESGAYNLTPTGPLTPETDTATFNGFVWQLARRTFFADPDSPPDPASPAWTSAIAFYNDRAITANFRWSWRGARLEQDVYRGAIRASDDAFRQRTNYFGALVVNHLVSAIDALISARMGHRPAAIPQVRIETAPGGLSLLWTGSF